MFLQLYRAAAGIGPGVVPVLRNEPYGPVPQLFLEAHPLPLAGLIDYYWGNRVLGFYPQTAAIAPLPFFELPADALGEYVLPHLIYAYMIENTRIYEIFEKVIFEYLHGEKAGFPTPAGTYEWLRATEETFYKGSSNYLIQSITSNIRSDIKASRRNAYYRMFGIDLNHGAVGSANYNYHRSPDANRMFCPLFEEFLSEVWIGITNVNNAVGADPTDDPRMNHLIRLLRDMLTTRKQSGNLWREEFFHVATMSWLHLTIAMDDAPIFQAMSIAAETPAERLRQMGEKVGIPAHPRADAFFEMAEAISRIFVGLELVPALNAQFFYGQRPPFGPGVLRDDVEAVITHWSIATNKDLKSLKVRTHTIGVSAPNQVGIAALGGAGISALRRESVPSNIA